MLRRLRALRRAYFPGDDHAPPARPRLPRRSLPSTLHSAFSPAPNSLFATRHSPLSPRSARSRRSCRPRQGRRPCLGRLCGSLGNLALATFPRLPTVRGPTARPKPLRSPASPTLPTGGRALGNVGNLPNASPHRPRPAHTPTAGGGCATRLGRHGGRPLHRLSLVPYPSSDTEVRRHRSPCFCNRYRNRSRERFNSFAAWVWLLFVRARACFSK
jgi:hypothetical protein